MRSLYGAHAYLTRVLIPLYLYIRFRGTYEPAFVLRADCAILCEVSESRVYRSETKRERRASRFPRARALEKSALLIITAVWKRFLFAIRSGIG